MTDVVENAPVKEALCVNSFEDIIQVSKDKDNFIVTRFVDRALCEDPQNKLLQVIPYVVFYNVDFNDYRIRFIEYNRGDGGNEERLYHSNSVGFGGHIDSITDLDYTLVDKVEGQSLFKMRFGELTQTAVNAGKREVEEELGFDVFTHFNIKPELDSCYFFLGDQDIEVNQVHVGLCVPVKLDKDIFDRIIELGNESKNEEIKELGELSIRLDNIVEEMDITVTLLKLTEELKTKCQLEEWSTLAITYLIRKELAQFLAPVDVKDIFKLAKESAQKQTQLTTNETTSS